MMFPKQKRFQSEEYKEFIRNLPCCVPGCTRRRNSKNNKRQVDPHHTKSVGAGGSDLTCIPHCDIHHEATHKLGCNTFQERHGVNYLREMNINLQKYIEEKMS